MFSATMERKGIGGGVLAIGVLFVLFPLVFFFFFFRDSRISYFLALMVTISALGHAHLCDRVCYGHWILDTECWMIVMDTGGLVSSLLPNLY